MSKMSMLISIAITITITTSIVAITSFARVILTITSTTIQLDSASGVHKERAGM